MARGTQRTEYTPETVTPPGHTLVELLQERRITQAELAKRTGRPLKTINEIVKGKAAITAETSLQLELVLGVPAAFWNERERKYREHLARRAEEERLETEVAWASRFPYLEMARRGWVANAKRKGHRARELLSYYGVASSDDWQTVYEAPQAAYRRSQKFDGNPAAISAWLRQGELEAQRIRCAPFDDAKFKSALKEARRLTTQAPAEFCPRLRELFAAAGVALVFVPELPGLPVSGVTRWLSHDKALVQLSLRYRSDDHLWFTLFHEAGHLVLHGKRLVFLEANGREGLEEQQANEFAANLLVPPTDYDRLRRLGRFSADNVRRFAEELGLSPGVVVGRLQHDHLIPFTHLNALKRRFVWSEEQ